MDRMTVKYVIDGKDYVTLPAYEMLEDKYKQLEEENKKLKEKLEKLQDEYDELYIEKCNASNQWKCCEAENKELKEKIQTLELWLDNKEKLNEEYRKQLDKYKRQYEHSMGEDDELIYEEGLYD